MPIAYPEILDVVTEPETFSWDERDTLLYALGVGFGRDPLNRRELEYVTEGPRLRTIGAMATMIGASSGLRLSRAGVDRRMQVHGEESMVLHGRIPVAGTTLAQTRVVNCYDHGPQVGAAVVLQTDLSNAADGTPIATIGMTQFARADGGFGGPSAPPSPPLPERAPDHVAQVATWPSQALLYRLLRDRNPIHVDPAKAARAGFPRPILHGLCLFGIAWRVILRELADFEPERIREQSVRFARPVFPGDVLSFAFWRQGEEVQFEASVEDRGPVLRNGRCRLA
jgi:acyl dehydratase